MEILSFKDINLLGMEDDSMSDKQFVSRSTIELIVKLTAIIAKATGFNWKFSSLVYNSYSHRTGHAWDLIPDIKNSDMKYYAHYNGSDPILHSRTKLIKDLQTVAHDDLVKQLIKRYSEDVVLVIAIEQNHLHIGLYRNKDYPELRYPNNVRIWKWMDPDPRSFKYADSAIRQKIFF